MSGTSKKKMPRRNSCNSGYVSAMKKKKLIDNRLLAISIVVEDYIYENKPITRYEAERYAKEVASYADKCLGDERSLQVIEKLRRHMKSIIAEQGSPDEDVFTQSLPGTSGTTPVYSRLDDDMTQYTQNTEVHDLTQEFDTLNCLKTPTENGTNNKVVAVKRTLRDNSELDEDLTHCTRDTEVEDLTQEFDNLETPIKKAKNKRNTRNTYSLDGDMTQCTQDFNKDNNGQQIKGQNKTDGSNAKARRNKNTTKHKNTPKSGSSGNDMSDLDVIDLCDDDIKTVDGCLNVEKSQLNTISSLNIPNNEILNLTACSPSILAGSDTVTAIPTPKDVSKIPNGYFKHTDNTVINLDESTKTLINTNIELAMDITETKIPENDDIPLHTEEKPMENSNNYKKKTKAINKQINTQVNTINRLRNIHKNSNIQTFSVNSIELSSKVDKALKSNLKVNKCRKDKVVIQDLSWIDNIKYVREIAIEEYEDILLPENFWNNFTLPGIWNPEDFSYS